MLYLPRQHAGASARYTAALRTRRRIWTTRYTTELLPRTCRLEHLLFDWLSMLLNGNGPNSTFFLGSSPSREDALLILARAASIPLLKPP